MNFYKQIIAICLLSLHTSSEAEKPPAKVMTVKVTEQAISKTQRLTGMIDFDRISEMSTEVGGLIQQQQAVEGQQIKKGESVLELNSDLLRKDIDIKTKERAQINVEISKIAANRKRLQSLLKNNSISRQAYDDTSFDLDSLRKKREILELELEKLQIILKKNIIKAPFDGLILEKNKEVGEWLSPGTAVTKVASIHNTVVKVSVSESQIRFQQTGASVPISIPALDLNTEGHIIGWVPVADQRSRSLTLKISLPYQEGLMQNMSARVEVAASEKRLLKVLPRDAVIQKQGDHLVYVVKEGLAKQFPINIISRTHKMVSIENPQLKVGMDIVVDGNDRLRPDQPVEVIKQLQ